MFRKVLGVSVAVMAVAGLCLVGACGDDENGGGDNGITDTTPECSDTITSIVVLQPTMSDTLRVGEAYDVKWCLPSTIELAQVEFSNDGGDTWQVLSSEGIVWPTNTFSFTPQAGDEGMSCVMRVGEYGNVGATQAMSGLFVVVSQ